MTELQNVLANNPKLLKEPDDYQIPTLTTVYNSALKIDNDTDLQTTMQVINFIKEGKTVGLDLVTSVIANSSSSSSRRISISFCT